jgi:hypothetical protein
LPKLGTPFFAILGVRRFIPVFKGSEPFGLDAFRMLKSAALDGVESSYFVMGMEIQQGTRQEVFYFQKLSQTFPNFPKLYQAFQNFTELSKNFTGSKSPKKLGVWSRT